jgi:hypothetical protein
MNKPIRPLRLGAWLAALPRFVPMPRSPIAADAH